MMRSLIQRISSLRVTAVPSAKIVIKTTIIQPNLVTVSAPKLKFSTMLTKPMTASASLAKIPGSTSSSPILTHPIRFSSTMKKRRMKMNKHKLKKRRKARRMNTKASRVV